MQPRHRVSRAAIDLIKRFEGYRRKAAQLPDGRWTIGHGHTRTARAGAEVSPEDAEALLFYDLIAITHGLNEIVYSPLTQNQFDALSSFAFSIGLDSFQESGVLKRLNEGALIQAACAMELWRKAEIGGERIVIDALVRRRSVEKTLFLTPVDGAWIAAPSPILRPLLDIAAHDVVPREAPAVVTAGLDGDAITVTREDGPAPPAGSPEPEPEGTVLAAAEAITARLQTIFAEPGTETAESEPPPPSPVEPPTHLDQIPAAPHPQADFGPPLDFHVESPPPEIEAPFSLGPPVDLGDSEDDALIGEDNIEFTDDEAPAGPDLFDAAPPANDPDIGTDDDLAFLSRLPENAPAEAAEQMPDDEFAAPAVQPPPPPPRGGLLALVASAVLGLAFFGGGVFWATNARPMSGAMWLDPRVVGWLAGVAGVGFFVVAAFILLERLGEASERSARGGR
jgi:lysozyme